MTVLASDVPMGPSRFSFLSAGDFASRILDKTRTGVGFGFIFFP